jgi:hypothetical protein
MTSIENFAESIGILYVQFMNEQLNLNEFQLEFNKEYQQAKEMHKQEIIEACNSGYDSWFDVIKYNSKGEQYYKETYDKTNG